MEGDWDNVCNFVKFLKVFYDITIKIYGTFYSTSNLYFQQLCTIQKNVLEYAQSSDPLMSDIKMKVKYDKYWGNFEKINQLLFVAVILDPLYKLVVIDYWCR